jgi:hypothetical protein
LIAERKLAPFRLCRQHRSAAAFVLGADAAACSAATGRVQVRRTDILARFVTGLVLASNMKHPSADLP